MRAEAGGGPNVNGSSIATVVRGDLAHSDADQRADDHAEEAEGQVRGRCRRRKPEREIGEEIHVRALTKAKAAKAIQVP